MKITFGRKETKSRGLTSVKPADRADGKESRLIVLADGERRLELGGVKRGEMNRRKFIILARRIVAAAKQHGLNKIGVNFSDFSFPRLNLPEEEAAELLAVNFETANFEFVKYKTKPAEGWRFVEEAIVAGKITAEIKKAFAKGQTIGREVNASRTLANAPGGEMTPSRLASESQKAARGTKVKVKILKPREIQKLKMGGIVGVSKGSVEKPRFITLEYWGGGKKERPIVLIGKGVTFDTGGLNIKPTDGIYEMHMDMSGGAAVIHAVILAAKLGLKKNVVGLVPAVENMTSGSSYRPGDILKSMSGKTIEVLNTDAEGRIILADALTYAKRYQPRLVVDVATLTGAAAVALGQRASAVFTEDPKLEKLFRGLGEESGDYVWPLPLWEEYEEEIKGTFGDVANIQKSKYGGAVIGAVFLWQFAKDFPWVHIDIAPRMTSIEGEYLAKGSAGAPVRLLIKLIEQA
ncbi:MAG: leucyl aminopeptidase [Candidatus Sungbacteria bacterium]|nr:leucyl aminopeptidase [Candidatus Sungbacteria bacterium]